MLSLLRVRRRRSPPRSCCSCHYCEGAHRHRSHGDGFLDYPADHRRTDVRSALAPTVAITANVTAQPTTGTLVIVGQAPTWSVIGSFDPNIVLSAANLQDTLSNIPPTRVADIDEPVDASDGEWWTATAPTVVTDVRVGFETPPASALVGTQQIKVLVRATSLPARDVTVELWEDGVKLTSEITEAVTSDTGQIITLSFPASEITDPADVEVRIVAEAA